MANRRLKDSNKMEYNLSMNHKKYSIQFSLLNMLDVNHTLMTIINGSY